jgi:signal transduction histidine kinase
MEQLHEMDPTTSLVPHIVCWAGSPHLIWTMAITNFITFASYLVICCTLLFLASRTRRVINRDWRYFVVAFALFIVACGATHLLEVITTWIPIFWVAAWTNILTAALSALVAISLIRRASTLAFGVNDYSRRLASTESEKRRMEASLLAARKLEDWSRLSAVVSHEISNPLEAVQNLLYLIRTADNVPPEISALASTASEEATRVLTISRSTLSFFRQSDAPEPINLRTAAESVRFLLDPILQKKGITVEIVPTGELTVQALPGETRQVLLNLVRNASEATSQPGATIRIVLTGRPADVEILIADHGSGIDPALMPTLFQFGSSTKGENGNGMGLWTVRHIIERHGGDITVQSTPGAGTTFTIHWPRTCNPIPHNQAT